MRQIGKSYLKLFLKLWVETLGSILFLMIFTMIIFGMLATPLQLSLRASNIDRQTNSWDKQTQSNFSLSSDFVWDVLYNGDEFKNIYGVISTQIEGGWFTDELKTVVALWAENQWLSIKDLVEASDLDGEEYIKGRMINQINYLVQFARLNGDEQKYRLTFDEEFFANQEQKIELTEDSTYELEVKNIYKPEVQAWFQAENVKNNVNWFVSNRIMELISKNESDFRYNTFNKIQAISSNNNQTMNYVIESANSTLASQVNDDLNNLIVKSGPSELKTVDKSSFDTNTTNPIEGYINDLFLESHDIKLGDVINVPFPISPTGENISIKIKIVGIAEKYSAITPQNASVLQSMKNFAQIFVDASFFNYENFFETLLPTNFKFDFSNTMNFQERFIKNSKYEINDWFSPSQLNYNLGIHNKGVSVFADMSDHYRISQITNLKIITWIFSIIGAILFILAFFFITFVLKKEINNTRKQLGVFKSIGYKTSELTWIFALKTFLTMFIAIAFGYILSIPFQMNASAKTYSSMVIFSYQAIYANPIFLATVCFLIPLFFALAAYWIIFRFLNEGALSLLTFGPKQNAKKWPIYIFYAIFPFTVIFIGINHILIKIFKRRNICFTYRMQDSFVKVGKGKYLIVMLLIGFTSFLFTIQLRALPILNGVINGIFNVYNEDVDHFYSYNNTSRLTYQDKVRINQSVIYSDMKYIDYSDYGSVENYLKNSPDNKFKNYEEIHELMVKTGEIREKIIDSNALETNDSGLTKYKEALPIALNALVLFYPLNELDNLTYENAINFIFQFITSGSEGLDTLISQMQNENNIYNLKNNTDQNSGLWLSDIGRYLCLSTQSTSYRNCDDVEAFQEWFLNEGITVGGDNNGGSGEQSGTQIDEFANSVFTDWMTEFLIRDLSTDQFIASNTILFNKKTELLTNNVEWFIDGNSEVNTDHSRIIMFDSSGAYGNVRTAYNFSSISDEQLAELTETGDELPAVVSARLAKILNLEIGDNYIATVGSAGRISQKIRVVGIVDSDNSSQTMYIDYHNFMDRFSDNLKEDDMYFTNLISQEESFEGELDLSQLENVSSMFKNKLKSTTIQTSTGKNANNWLGPVLDIYFKNIKYIELDEEMEKIIGPLLERITTDVLTSVDNRLIYTISANPLGGVITVLPIIKSVINQVMNQVQNSMIMYIAIDVVLMIILLVVIMNIVVNDSINIIMIMRSLGYTDRKINWMVMGRYVVGAVIVFIFAYIFSIILWEIVKYVVWNKFKMLLIIPTIPWIPFASFIAIALIMLCGWLAAMYQIKNRPLTYLVS